MNPVDFLKVYLCMNVLLAAGFVFFSGLQKIFARFQIDFSFSDKIKAAQILIFAAILVPMALHLMPSKQLPPLEWGVFHTESETLEGRSLLKKPPMDVRPSPKIELPPPEKSFYDHARIWIMQNLEYKIPTLAVFALITGFALMLIRLSCQASFLLRSVRQAHVIRKLGRVRIALSESVVVPFSVQLFNQSWVVVPSEILQNAKDFAIVVRHELQHHRQRDTLWALVIEFLQCLFFLNPAIYLWKREVIELQEFSCDEALIGHKGVSSRDYGSCLVRVAEAALRARQVYVGTTCMAASSQNSNYQKSFLRRRIEVFTSQERPRYYGWAGALIGTLSVSLTLAVAVGAEKSLRKDEDQVNSGTVVVDPEIQAIADKVLESAIKNANAKAGFAIVADPNTGKILAVANIDTEKKLKGYWSLSQVLEPASVIKTLVAAEAIEKGATTPDESHNCENGTYKYGQRTYHDWKESGWDHLTTTETIAHSSDICSIKIGEKLGVAGVKQMLTDFGFGPGGTAKDFPMAKPGTLPPPEDQNNPRLIPHVSAGFGFRVTPLEMLQAYGAIANGGKLLMPKSANESQTQVVRQVLTSQNSEKVKEILRQVVLSGTAKQAVSEKYSTAGKTATSYIPDLTEWDLVKGRHKGNFAAFIGFAPVKDPKVEIYVGLHDPNTDKSGAHGNAHAAPVFRQLAEEVLAHMKVPADLKAM